MPLNCTRDGESWTFTPVRLSFLGLLLIIAVVLNFKTFYIILKQKREVRKAVTIFLLNLTLVSGLMALLLIPFDMSSIVKKRWIFGDVFCEINGFANVFLCSNLVFTLVCMTFDRYLSVMKPLKHRVVMTMRVAFQMLLVANIVSFILAITPVVGIVTYKYHPGTNHCSPTWHTSCTYYFVSIFLGFLIPVVGMLVTYTRIILKIRSNRVKIGKSQFNASSKHQSNENKGTSSVRHASNSRVAPISTNVFSRYKTDNTIRKSIPSVADEPSENITPNVFQEIQVSTVTDALPSTSRSTRRQSRLTSMMRTIKNRLPQEYKVARAGFLLVVTFAVLWTPYLVAHSCFNEECNTPQLFSVSMFLVYLNTVANPIIYALTNRAVSRSFTIHCKKYRRSAENARRT